MQRFNSDEFLLKFRYPLLILLIGAVLISGGIFLLKSGALNSTKVEVLGESETSIGTSDLTVEIAGQVINPGVYKLPPESRVEDLLSASGGFSANADRDYTDKYLNRAAKITDGQKIYIPDKSEHSSNSTASVKGVDQSASTQNSVTGRRPVNINTASLSELDSLPGIGQVYGQKIIDQRPYSNVSELLSKGALTQSIYNKVKDLVSTY